MQLLETVSCPFHGLIIWSGLLIISYLFQRVTGVRIPHPAFMSGSSSGQDAKNTNVVPCPFYAIIMVLGC
jgi:hypothetical protein